MAESTNRKVLGEQYYNQVSESIKSVFELSTRIDERVQLMMKKQEDLDRKIELQITHGNSLSNRISLLESNDSRKDMESVREAIDELQESIHKLELQVQEVQGESGRSEDRWKGIFSFIGQIVWVLLAAYMLYRLGLQGPP